MEAPQLFVRTAGTAALQCPSYNAPRLTAGPGAAPAIGPERQALSIANDLAAAGRSVHTPHRYFCRRRRMPALHQSSVFRHPCGQPGPGVALSTFVLRSRVSSRIGRPLWIANALRLLLRLNHRDCSRCENRPHNLAKMMAPELLGLTIVAPSRYIAPSACAPRHPTTSGDLDPP